ncbi:hypothetical protein CH273_02935 [Rhodococcus sp. 05-339-2]|uniref:PadR family transcriptional regulator n=1 Tax=Rhodococcoides fascians TaxID=1828 RepID=UPI00050BF813|nr:MULTISPECIES: helix-turn-helix transcriptional regulator [Rhodococcus]OZD85711.1 hypothetical protein CH273_02935 [Rhodococcus sp. 05-339-2]
MPTNALLNPLVLPILGLLVEEPRHSYAIFTELRSRHAHMTVRNGTVYTLIERLRAEGWIRNDDSRTPSTVEITPEGVEALRQKVIRQVIDSELIDGHAFTTALAYVGILDKQDARELLSVRATAVRDALAGLDDVLRKTDVPPLHMIEAHYMRSKLAHDADWLEQTIADVDSGNLVWVTGR